MNHQIDNTNDHEDGDQPYEDWMDGSASESSEGSDTPRKLDPMAQILNDLTADLNSLTLEAETILSRQPRATQVVLSLETKRLFSQYEKYGSMARLKVGVQKFMRLGDEKGKLRIKDDTKEDEEEEPLRETLRPRRPPRPAHYGKAFMLNFTADDDKPKYDAEKDFITPLIRDPFNPDPNNYISHPLRIIDADSIPYITTLPWDPIATRLTWPARLGWAHGFLSSINKILSLADHESRIRLFHHVTKWGPSPVFRAGIAEHVKAQYAGIFETAQEHYLGMTPETRTFLRDIYFKKQHLNHVERRLLALACRIDEDSVQMFWEDLAESLRGYGAMRTFMAAREIEKNGEAKAIHDEEVERKRHKQREQAKNEAEAQLMAFKANKENVSLDVFWRDQMDESEEVPRPRSGAQLRPKLGGEVFTAEDEKTMSAGMSVTDRKRFDPDYAGGPEAF